MQLASKHIEVVPDPTVALPEFELRSSLAAIGAATRLLVLQPEKTGELVAYIHDSISRIRTQIDAATHEVVSKLNARKADNG